MDIKMLEGLRKEKKISQKELSEKIGISQVAYANMIKRGDMKVSILEKIAEILDIPVGSFFSIEQFDVSERSGGYETLILQASARTFLIYIELDTRYENYFYQIFLLQFADIFLLFGSFLEKRKGENKIFDIILNELKYIRPASLKYNLHELFNETISQYENTKKKFHSNNLLNDYTNKKSSLLSLHDTTMRISMKKFSKDDMKNLMENYHF